MKDAGKLKIYFNSFRLNAVMKGEIGRCTELSFDGFCVRTYLMLWTQTGAYTKADVIAKWLINQSERLFVAVMKWLQMKDEIEKRKMKAKE